MFEKLKSILYKNQFDVFFGKVYEESNLHGIAVNYYFTNSIVKIPNKNFIGLPDYTFRLLLYSARLLKDEKEREVRIFDGEYVLILYKSNMCLLSMEILYKKDKWQFNPYGKQTNTKKVIL